MNKSIREFKLIFRIFLAVAVYYSRFNILYKKIPNILVKFKTNLYSMKIKEQTRKQAVGCSKHRFEVADRADEVSNHIYGKATLTWFELVLIDLHWHIENTVLMGYNKHWKSPSDEAQAFFLVIAITWNKLDLIEIRTFVSFNVFQHLASWLKFSCLGLENSWELRVDS